MAAMVPRWNAHTTQKINNMYLADVTNETLCIFGLPNSAEDIYTG